jgi:hypothetical protein
MTFPFDAVESESDRLSIAGGIESLINPFFAKNMLLWYYTSDDAG